MAKNLLAGKFQEGTFAGGQGPINGIEIRTEPETKGVLGTDQTSGRKLSTAGGSGDGLMAGTPADKNFDLYSKTYAGPGNLAFKPENKGEVNNFEVNK